MDVSEYLREPVFASIFAAAVTALYIHCKAKLNKQEPLKTSDYAKPAALIGLLVYYIVSSGVATREKISSEPF